MNFKQLMLEIKNLNLHSPEEWDEYISHFSNPEEIIRYIEENPQGSQTLAERIRTNQGAEPAKPNTGISQKIVNLEYLSDQRSQFKLGVVSGVYDLLHLGHLMGMAYAKQLLEQDPNPRLCALTLSDEDVRAKKGESRPILNLNERLEMLCNVKHVDFIVPLEEPNCLTVLEKVKPDYFFKDSAGRTQDIVRAEQELVESFGGSVVICPAENDIGISTTRLIEKVKK